MGQPQTAKTLRERVRAELVDEIKAAARRRIATEGANLSMRAVARDLGLVSSALYRYFPSRDDLLTALIIEAYDAIGSVAEAADRAAVQSDLLGRFQAVARAIRRWALATPYEYALIFGSPVPGYAAPADTIGPATRTTAVLTAILRDGVTSGHLTTTAGDRLPRSVRADLARMGADPRFAGVPEPIMARGIAAWVQIIGLISFELFGQLKNVIIDQDAFFEVQIGAAARQLGL